MSTEENKAVVRRFYEAWNRGDSDAVIALFDANIVDHNAPPGVPPGLDGVKQGLGEFMSAFPGSQITIDDLLAHDDKVMDRSTFTGINKGAMFGIPPTGKSATFQAMNVYRIANGKIVELWHIENIVSMMQQLGVMPAPGQDAPATAMV